MDAYVPIKSMTRRPSEQRPVGCWKYVSPYGEKRHWQDWLMKNVFPVSASESPKLKTDV
jgi:hypothetical protein